MLGTRECAAFHGMSERHNRGALDTDAELSSNMFCSSLSLSLSLRLSLTYFASWSQSKCWSHLRSLEDRLFASSFAKLLQRRQKANRCLLQKTAVRMLKIRISGAAPVSQPGSHWPRDALFYVPRLVHSPTPKEPPNISSAEVSFPSQWKQGCQP